MKALLTRKLTNEEKNLIGCLFMLVGLLFIVFGIRTSTGADTSLWTVIGLFMFPTAIGFLNPIDYEEED